MDIVVWIGLGWLVGVIAKALTPRHYQSSWLVYMSVGIAGGVVGGWAGSVIWQRGMITNLSWYAWVSAIVGAVVMLWIYLLLMGPDIIGNRRERKLGEQANSERRPAA
jgi:uncharacterized membrane protein YeaQ/YmgE (transglycosylase-associated protein family)